MDWAGFIVTLGQSLSYPAFWVGFVLVALFAHSRFEASEADSESKDPRVVSRSFTTRFRYGLSAIAYIAFFEFCYGLLVGIGSLPVLQDLLTHWIGSLEISTDTGKQIGTPAWAALFVTAVLPSAPGFGSVDRKFRKTLHNFASIPYKARGLAKEILDNLTCEQLSLLYPDKPLDAVDDESSIRLEAAQLRWLFDAIEKLQDGNNIGNRAENYRKFFNLDYHDIWHELQQKKDQIEVWLETPTVDAPVVASELQTLLTTTARFISCALLLNEASERNARSTIREQLGIEQLPKLAFDFKLEQIVLNILLAFMLTVAGSIGALAFALPGGWGAITGVMVGVIIFWLPFIAITMVVPFIFAAGLRLYFIDRLQSEKSIPFEDQLLGVICLFLFTFGLGVIPTSLGLLGGKYQLTENWVMQVVPSGITPAVIAILFYFLANTSLVKSRWVGAALDLLIFSTTAWVLTWMSTRVAIQAGLNVEEMMQIDGITNEILLVVSSATHAIMVGVIGAIQCFISRVNLTPAKDSQAPQPRPVAQT